MKNNIFLLMQYDKIYSQKDFYWGLEADWIVVHAIQEHLLKSSRVKKCLDLGCGEGRNSFELSKNGLTVDAVDLSSIGIKKLENYSSLHKLNITSFIQDAGEYMNSSTVLYDAIFSLNLFQSLSRQKALHILSKIQNATNIGGYNIISSIIVENEEQKQNIISKGGFAFEEGELKDIYKNWDIVFYNEGYSNWRPHEGNKKSWNIVELIAKKHG